MIFFCPFSSLEFRIQGINAAARQRLPHPVIQSGYRQVYNARKTLPLHLVMIRSLIETGLVTFESPLQPDESLRDVQRLQIVDYLHSMLDFIALHASELPKLNISHECNSANVLAWQEELNICILLIQHQEKSLKNTIYQASLPFNDLVARLRKNDQGSNRFIQRVFQSQRDTQALLILCGLEESKEFYLTKNLEPSIYKALDEKNYLLYHTLCGLREEQNKIDNSLNAIHTSDQPTKSLKELLEEKRNSK